MYQPGHLPYSGHEPNHQPMRPSLHIPNPPTSQFAPYSPANNIQIHPSQMQSQMPPQGMPPQGIPSQGMSQCQPQSPSDNGERVINEEDFFNLPGPPPTAHIWEGYIWALYVVQHPRRARMCGFGDKDRRPISPPPCVRLVILDETTRKEINYNDIDLTHLVLTVDIWDLHANREMNLVKQSNASPTISSAATGAYPSTVVAGSLGMNNTHRPFDIAQIPPYNQNYYTSRAPNYPQRQSYVNGQTTNPPPYQPSSSPYSRSAYPQSFDPRYGQAQAPPTAQAFAPAMAPMNIAGGAELGYMSQGPTTTQMYTRNLIGSLCASAFKLKDENDKLGIWFVLQDLSVRTEGWFRLKMNFFNIKQAVEKAFAEGANGPAVNRIDIAAAPLLASTFSNPFRVYSAKKFPGVVESTPLSKAFANQGIKIPIRKDTGGKRGREESEDENSDN